jgi:D-sedoheptulose 7-phosphate isomerase
MKADALTTIGEHDLQNYFLSVSDLLCGVEVTSKAGQRVGFTEAATALLERARGTHAAGNKLMFIGNGGSAAIASHMATDYSKNGGVRALALNDASMLTCLGNDLGYDRVFAKQIELHARKGDLVIAISSSGRSANILNAVDAAAAAGCTIATMSGFTPDNPLRRKGEWNFFVASDRYGFVEIGHLTICHAVLDFLCGLPAPGPR